MWRCKCLAYILAGTGTFKITVFSVTEHKRYLKNQDSHNLASVIHAQHFDYMININNATIITHEHD